MGDPVVGGGAAFTLTDLDCEFWIDDASLVDKSGNSRDATFNNTGEEPGVGTYDGQSSVAALTFDVDKLNVPSLPTTKILTYCTVYNHTGSQTLISAWGGSNTFLPLTAPNNTNVNNTRVSNNNNKTGRRILSGGELTESATTRGDAYDAMTNGNLVMITIPAGPVATTLGQGSSASFRLDGELAAAFVIAGDLTTLEIEKIQGYCAHTYGFDLPTGHTYENSPP